MFRWGLVLSVLGMLTFPILEIRGHWLPRLVVTERIPTLVKPAFLWSEVVNRDWQNFLERCFLYNLGSLRAFLIFANNEVKDRLFKKRPTGEWVWSPEMGYYQINTIRRLNADVLNRDVLRQHYLKAARRLRVLQTLLKNHGVTFLVVTAPSKSRIYPESIGRYLVASAQDIPKQAISYGDVLEEGGVNVVSGVRILEKEKKVSSRSLFTTVGYHWNYLAGCMVTRDMLRKAERLSGRHSFDLDCSDISYEPFKWADRDVAWVRNIFSQEAVRGRAPYPVIVPSRDFFSVDRGWMIVGDSFSDQIVSSLTQALPERSWRPGWLVTIDLRTSVLQKFNMNGEKAPEEKLRPDALFGEVLSRDLVILEVSDEYILRDPGKLDEMEFGATRILLQGLLSSGKDGGLDLKNTLTDGWAISKSGRWEASGSRASLVIPSPASGGSVGLALDVESIAPEQSGPRFLNVSLEGQPMASIKMPSGRGRVTLAVPPSHASGDILFRELSFASDSGGSLATIVHGVKVTNVVGDRIGGPLTEFPVPLAKKPEATCREIFDLISAGFCEALSSEGMSDLESNSAGKWRWTLGPKTRIKFYVDSGKPGEKQPFLLNLVFNNDLLIPAQVIDFRFNGKSLRSFDAGEIGTRKPVALDTFLMAEKGVNILEIIYKDWNHGKKGYAERDPRQLAVKVTRFTLQRAEQTANCSGAPGEGADAF